MSAIGLMDGAFFVGRKDIVDWINTTLQLSLDKVEESCSGAIACQLLDIMHPNTVPMSKVNWNAKKDFEYVENYKSGNKDKAIISTLKFQEDEIKVNAKNAGCTFIGYFKVFY